MDCPPGTPPFAAGETKKSPTAAVAVELDLPPERSPVAIV
jgi:hypothetical protein